MCDQGTVGDQLLFFRTGHNYLRIFQVGTMEALNKKLTGDDTEFSEQYFVDCTFSYSGCAGGTTHDGYKVTMMRQYILSAEDWPYTAACWSIFNLLKHLSSLFL